MKFAIIAAGEGSRLSQEGVAVPKPLVKIKGETMIGRLFRIFNENGATEIVVIANTLNNRTADYIKDCISRKTFGNIRLVEKTTPSSMHSFYEISPYLEDGPFCLTTVDTIFREDEFKCYIEAFRQCRDDALMGVTDFVDDEKPLYVGTDTDMNITGFHDVNEGDTYISGGIYCLRPSALPVLRKCVNEGKSRMRNFQRALVESGLHLKAWRFSKVIDVDHLSDIKKAEHFVANYTPLL